MRRCANGENRPTWRDFIFDWSWSACAFISRARALSPRVDSSARGDRPHGHRHLLSIPAHGPARTVFAIPASTSGLMLAATARSQSRTAGWPLSIAMPIEIGNSWLARQSFGAETRKTGQSPDPHSSNKVFVFSTSGPLRRTKGT
jgi:hypothetical protein